MSASLRVLHVVRGLTNSSGTTHIVVPLSEEQARQGLDVTVLFVAKDDEAAVTPCGKLVASRCFPQSLPLRNPGVSLAFAKELDRRIGEFDFVHIHAIWNFPTYYAMRAAHRAEVPYMVAPQGSLEPWALRQNYWGKRIYGSVAEIPFLERAAYLQGVSTREVEQIKAYGLRAPTVIIPNGVSLRSFDLDAPPLGVRLGIDPTSKTVLYLSRLTPKKGADLLIEAFSRLPAEVPATLVIMGGDAGSGYEARLKQLASERGLGSRCVFYGEIRGEEKYRALLGADIFVLPSHSEGLPVAVLEAMAAGRPVVITPGCNLSEVGEWDAGCIVAAEAGALAATLTQLISRPERAIQMGANGRRLVEAKFTWERIAARTVEAYKGSLMQTRATNSSSSISNRKAEALPLTAIILTQDEAINIGRCLDCLRDVSDVAIVDSGSSDATLEIAKATRPGVRIYSHPFRDFGDQRNWALEHTEPRHEWILFVDADEFCTDELKSEIAAWLREPVDYVGGFIAGKNYFLGRFLKHATMYPSYQLRLLKLGKVTFRKEGHGQREVTDGALHYFTEGWIHEALSKGLRQWIDRHNAYSSEEVELILQLRREPLIWRDLLSINPISRRRGLKRLGAKLPGRPLSRFLYTYVWRRGFLDGIPGLAYCLLRLGHDIHIFAKLQERRFLASKAPDAQPQRLLKSTDKEKSIDSTVSL